MSLLLQIVPKFVFNCRRFIVVSHHVMLPEIFLLGGISVARRPNKLRGGKLEFDSTKALEVNDKLTPGPFQYNAVGFQEYI